MVYCPGPFFPLRSLTSLVNELELMDRDFSEWLIPTLNAISRCISLNQDTSLSPFTNIRKLYGAIHQGVLTRVNMLLGDWERERNAVFSLSEKTSGVDALAKSIRSTDSQPSAALWLRPVTWGAQLFIAFHCLLWIGLELATREVKLDLKSGLPWFLRWLLHCKSYDTMPSRIHENEQVCLYSHSDL